MPVASLTAWLIAPRKFHCTVHPTGIERLLGFIAVSPTATYFVNGAGVTRSVSDAVLFEVSGSGSSDDTTADSAATRPGAMGRTVTRTVAVAPGDSAPSEQVTVWPAVQAPCDDDTPRIRTDTGSASLNDTLLGDPGPAIGDRESGVDERVCLNSRRGLRGFHSQVGRRRIGGRRGRRRREAAQPAGDRQQRDRAPTECPAHRFRSPPREVGPP
jgi:hypothetical protein